MADKRAKLVLGLFMVSAIVVLALSFYTGFSLNSLMSSLEQSRSERLLAEAQAASLIVSADELDAIRSTKALSSEEGAALERRLSAFATLHNLTEVSFVRQLPSGELQYIVSSNPGINAHDISSPPFASNDLFETALLGSVKITGLQGSELDASPFMAYSPVQRLPMGRGTSRAV